MDFLNRREGTVTLETLGSCVSLKKQKSQDKAVEVTVNSKDENSLDFCQDFVQEFDLSTDFKGHFVR